MTDADLINNRLSLIGGTTSGNSVWGIYTFGTGIRISGSSLSSITATGTTTTATGIEVDPSGTGAGGFVYGNQISGATYGIFGGKDQQNLTDNCTTPLSNGVAPASIIERRSGLSCAAFQSLPLFGKR